MATELEDLAALPRATGARFVLGISGGACVALEAVLTMSGSDSEDGDGGLVRKVAIFESQLVCGDWGAFERGRERFEREIDEGKTAVALIVALKMSEMGWWGKVWC